MGQPFSVAFGWVSLSCYTCNFVNFGFQDREEWVCILVRQRFSSKFKDELADRFEKLFSSMASILRIQSRALSFAYKSSP